MTLFNKPVAGLGSVENPVKVDLAYVVSLAWCTRPGVTIQGTITGTYLAESYETQYEIDSAVIQKAGEEIEATGLVTVLFMKISPNITAGEMVLPL